MASEQERDIAQSIGGRVVPGSGAVPGLEGDAISQHWLAEAKATRTRRHVLDLSTWEKISGEAGINLRKPVLFLRVDGTDLAVVSREDFEELRRKAGL